MSYIIQIYNRLYFSAHWCPPCRKFTPILATAYNAHDLSSRDGNTCNDDATTTDEIEVIFISLDSVKSEYDSYRSNMPWPSVSKHISIYMHMLFLTNRDANHHFIMFVVGTICKSTQIADKRCIIYKVCYSGNTSVDHIGWRHRRSTDD